MKYILIIFLAAGLSSCGTTYHLKRAKHHLKMAEVKGAGINTDTVYVSREIIVPEIKVDTLIQVKNWHDTTTVIRDRVVTKFKIDTVTKTVYFSVECPGDTIRIQVPVRVTTEIESKPKSFWIGWIIVAFCVGGAFGLFVSKGKFNGPP